MSHRTICHYDLLHSDESATISSHVYPALDGRPIYSFRLPIYMHTRPAECTCVRNRERGISRRQTPPVAPYLTREQRMGHVEISTHIYIRCLSVWAPSYTGGVSSVSSHAVDVSVTENVFYTSEWACFLSKSAMCDYVLYSKCSGLGSYHS